MDDKFWSERAKTYVTNSESMIKIAEQKANESNLTNICWKCSDVGSIDLLNGKYNMITAINILLYVSDIENILNHIYDLLDDSGWFLSTTDYIGESNVLLRKGAKFLSKINVIPKMHIFKVDGLKKVIGDAGFEIIMGENIHSGEPNYFIAARKR